MVGHVRDSLEQVDEDTWLIDSHLLLHRSRSTGASKELWRDEQGWHFSISDAPTPPPASSPLSADSFPKLIYDVGDASVVFDLGAALLRVKDRHPFHGVTPELATLNWLAERELSFPVPRPLYHSEFGNRAYFIVTRVPGRSIDEAWRDLNDEQKAHCITRTAQICIEVSVWTSEAITGIDGKWLFDPWLDRPAGRQADLSPENLRQNCEQLHMDMSRLVFSHNDIGPTNVMVDVNDNCNIGVVDWEMAGFVPFAWVRTKLATCYAMDFCWKGVGVEDPSMKEWRERLAEELGKHHVPQVDVDEYRAWVKARRST